MGLDISHGTWSGAYSGFHRWRKIIAEVAGLPPLELMEGFYEELSSLLPTLYPGIVGEYSNGLKELDKRLPIKWDCLKSSPLHELLNHSDCDGQIEWKNCKPIAEELSKLLDKLPGSPIEDHRDCWMELTQKFINGLMRAYNAKENLEFR